MRLGTGGIVHPDAERDGVGDTPCVCCGKATRGERWVHLAGYGGQFVTEDEPVDETEDLGWFPIGPECAKKLPAGYVSSGA